MAAGLALLGAGACEKATPATDDLSKDLAVAGSQNNDLALSPAAGRTDVVSSVERIPTGAPKSAPSRSIARPVPRPNAAPLPTPAASPAPAPVVAPTPAPQPEASPDPEPEHVPTVIPHPAPRPTQQKPGGWKSIGDVIRDAPFPINP